MTLSATWRYRSTASATTSLSCPACWRPTSPRCAPAPGSRAPRGPPSTSAEPGAWRNVPGRTGRTGIFHGPCWKQRCPGDAARARPRLPRGCLDRPARDAGAGACLAASRRAAAAHGHRLPSRWLGGRPAGSSPSCSTAPRRCPGKDAMRSRPPMPRQQRRSGTGAISSASGTTCGTRNSGGLGTSGPAPRGARPGDGDVAARVAEHAGEHAAEQAGAAQAPRKSTQRSCSSGCGTQPEMAGDMHSNVSG